MNLLEALAPRDARFEAQKLSLKILARLGNVNSAAV
jgi:hypothetical protein